MGTCVQRNYTRDIPWDVIMYPCSEYDRAVALSAHMPYCKEMKIMKHIAWQSLVGLVHWYPIIWSSLCNSFDDRAPVDEIHKQMICGYLTETQMSSFWWNFHHWLHWKLSKWQLSVQPVMKFSSKWRYFRSGVDLKIGHQDSSTSNGH